MNTVTRGSAIYRDQYVKQDGTWKIKRSEYDRIWEEIEPRNPDTRLTVHYLADHGRSV
jgi:hypothetical protein